jgi:hypothetical protein
VRARILTPRTAKVGISLLCFALATLLLILALDVHRWSSSLSNGDVHYRVTPEAGNPWQVSPLVPLGVARSLLDVQDDVDFRYAMQAFRLARLEDATVSDPQVALLRNFAQARLEAIAAGSDDRRRRSRAAGLLGAIGLARLMSETQDRVALLEATVASLQLALALDPGNDEAKFNLELALQRGRGLQLTEGSGGANPSPGGSGAKGAGVGQPGTGY